MSRRSGAGSRSDRDAEPPGADDQSAFAAMLDEHEAHLFDYCSRLVGDQAEAVSATETAMNAAQSLLADPDRLRAWLFALARQEIAAKMQPSDQHPDAEVLDLVYRHGIRPEDLPAVLGISPKQAMAMLAGAEAEVGGLAGMDAPGDDDAPADADATMEFHATTDIGAPAEFDGLAEAGAPSLVDAPVEVAWLVELAEPAGDTGSAESGAERLADPPSWIWDRTAAAFIDDDTDPRGIPVLADSLAGAALGSALEWSGAPDQPAFGRARRRLGISAVLVVAAGSAAAAIVYLGGSPSGQADTHGGAQRPNAGSAATAVSSPAPAPHSRSARHSQRAARHHHRRSSLVSAPFPAQPTSGFVPVTSTSTSKPTGVLTPPPAKKPHPSPTAHKSPPPTITPSPTPTPSASPTATPSP